MTIAIETKFIGPSNSRGARVKAFARDSFSSTDKPVSVTLSWDYALSPIDNHRSALEALARRQGWFWDWIEGNTASGYVFVRLPNDACGFSVTP